MFRKLVGALIVMTVVIGFVAAGEYNCVVSKVDGNKITCYKTKKVKGKAPEKVGEDFVLTVNKDAVIAKGVFNKDAKKFEKGDAIEGGLKADIFAKIGEKGITVRVTTDDDDKKASQILVVGGKKKAAAQ